MIFIKYSTNNSQKSNNHIGGGALEIAMDSDILDPCHVEKNEDVLPIGPCGGLTCRDGLGEVSGGTVLGRKREAKLIYANKIILRDCWVRLAGCLDCKSWLNQLARRIQNCVHSLKHTWIETRFEWMFIDQSRCASVVPSVDAPMDTSERDRTSLATLLKVRYIFIIDWLSIFRSLPTVTYRSIEYCNHCPLSQVGTCLSWSSVTIKRPFPTIEATETRRKAWTRRSRSDSRPWVVIFDLWSLMSTSITVISIGSRRMLPAHRIPPIVHHRWGQRYWGENLNQILVVICFTRFTISSNKF